MPMAISGYFWQTAAELADRLGISRSTVYNRACGRTQPDHVPIESRQVLPTDQHSGVIKLFRIQPPYYGTGIAGGPGWIATITGIDANFISNTTTYQDAAVGVYIERQIGPFGPFWFVEDLPKRQDKTMQQVETEKQDVTPWLPYKELAEHIGVPVNNLQRAYYLENATYTDDGEGWRIERRVAHPDEIKHNSQVYVWRGVMVPASKARGLGSRLVDEIDGGWVEFIDYKPVAEVAEQLDCSERSINNCAKAKRLLFDKYRIERKQATQAIRDKLDNPYLKYVCRVMVPKPELVEQAETVLEPVPKDWDRVLKPIGDTADDTDDDQGVNFAAVAVSMAAVVAIIIALAMLFR